MADSILNYSNFVKTDDMVSMVKFPASYTRVGTVADGIGISHIQVSSPGLYVLVGAKYGYRVPPQLWKYKPSSQNDDATINWDLSFLFDDETNHGILFFTARMSGNDIYIRTNQGEFKISDNRFYCTMTDAANEGIYLCKINQIS